MRSARRATVALFGIGLLGVTGCHRARPVAGAVDARATIYALAISQLQPDTARWMVIDSLMPATDIDVDLYDKMVAELRVSTTMLDSFLSAQRAPAEHYHHATLPAPRFEPLRVAQLDSMRRQVRDDITSGRAERGPNNDLFWRRWRAAFPGTSGYVMLSPALISADGLEALVQVRIACGPYCGKAELRHFTRDRRGAWRPALTVVLSES